MASGTDPDPAYVVEIREPPEQLEEALVDNLIRIFSIRREKAERILRRVPGVMSKPLSKEEAERVAGLFVEAGLAAFARPEGFSGPGLRAFNRPRREGDDWSFEPPLRQVQKLKPQARTPNDLRLKMLAAIMLPSLLVLAVALGAVYWLVGEAMRAQRLEAAYLIAMTAAGLAATNPDLAATLPRLQDTGPPSLRLLVLLDGSGVSRAGWYGDAPLNTLPPALQLELRELAGDAGNDSAPARLHGDTGLVLAAHPLQGGSSAGTLVVGLAHSLAPLPTVLLLILLVGLVPLLLGLLLALKLARDLSATPPG